MYVNFIGCSRRVMGAPLAPGVTAGIGKHISLGVEVGAADGAVGLRKSLETLFVVLVPEINDTVRSNRGKGPKLMKGNGIDAKDIVFLAMAFEGKRVLSSHLLEVVHTHPSFDGTDTESRHIGKCGNASGLEFEGGFLSRVFAGLSLDVVGNNVSSGAGHHQERLLHVQIVTSFGQLNFHGRCGLSGVPKLEHIVPPSRHDHIGRRQIPHALDGTIVRPNLLRYPIRRLLSKRPHAHRLIRSPRKHLRSIRRKRTAQHWTLSLMIHLCFGKCLNLGVVVIALPTSDAAVPIGGNEMVTFGTPCQGGNSVVSGRGDIVIIGCDRRIARRRHARYR
mmetsp:Transcript_24148/g.43623  ORF Transcript_24148/g.43623 Transcript_24148/m.43623 type:complete len:334 (+) Transcript_24148:85-1086(+)